jgi:hypothetical protein
MHNLAQRIDPFTVDFERTNSLRRWPCDTCGGYTDKIGILPVWCDEDGDRHDMCDRCVVSSPDEVRSRLLSYAEALESWAAVTRRWAQAEWEMPSLEQTAEAVVRDMAEEVDYYKSAGVSNEDLDSFDRDEAFRSRVELLQKLRDGYFDGGAST